MSSKRLVVKNSFYYLFSTILINGMGFLLLPIVTKYLVPDDYGIINLIYSFSQVATYLISFSLYSSILRYYGDYENKDNLKRFIGTIQVFLAISGVIFLTGSFTFGEALSTYLFNGIDYYPTVFIGLISLFFTVQLTFHHVILQSRQSGKKLAIINIITFIILVSSKLIFIVVYNMGALGVLLSQVITYGLYSVYMIYDLRKCDLIAFSFDLIILKKSLAYSIPIIPHNISTMIAGYASRLFITNHHALGSVGLYSIAFQLTALIDVIQTSVNRAFQPWFFNKMRDKKINKEEILKLTDLLLITYTVLILVLGLASKEIVIVMTSQAYHDSWRIMPILLFGFALKSIYYFYVNIIMFYKKLTNQLFIATLAGSASDIILAFYLIKMFDRTGAALSFVLAKVIVITLIITIAKKSNTVGYSASRMMQIIAPSLGFMYVGLYFSYTIFPDSVSCLDLVYKLSIMILYLLFLYTKHWQKYGVYIISIAKERKIFERN